MDINCEKCKKRLSKGIFNYSINTFRKALCINCQKDERGKTYPPKLAKFINKKVDDYHKIGKCTKCGEVVKSDEDALCQSCI